MVDFAVVRITTIPLRCLGHLLLGICRIVRWKASYLDSDADEIRNTLRMSTLSHGLPVVAVVPESAVNVRREMEAPLCMSPPWGNGDGPEMLLEPHPLEVDAALEAGRRHVAPVDRITMVPPLPPPTTLLGDHEGRDAFGALSPADHAAMDAVSQDPWALPPGRGDSLAPVQLLLGDRDTAGSFQSGDRLSGQILPQLNSSKPAGVLEYGVPWSPLGAGEGEDVATPLDVRRRLSYDAPALELSPLGWDGRLLDSIGLSPLHAEELAGSVAPLRDASLAPEEDDAAAPHRKRARRKLWLDERVHLSREERQDTADITLNPVQEYGIYLPHARPGLRLSTVVSDVCIVLCGTLEQAPEVGAKRRRARAEQMEQVAAEAESDAIVSGIAADVAARHSELGTPAAGDTCTGMELVVASPTRPDATPFALAGEPGASSPGGLPPIGGDEPQGWAVPPGALYEGRLHEDPTGELPGGYMPESPDLDEGRASSPGALLQPEYSALEGVGALVSPDPPRVRPRRDRIGDPTEQNLAAVAMNQEDRLKRTFDVEPDQEVSFFELCDLPPGGAEAGACRFLNVLSMHMEGIISLDQAEPYEDIILRRGPNWPPAEALA